MSLGGFPLDSKRSQAQHKEPALKTPFSGPPNPPPQAPLPEKPSDISSSGLLKRVDTEKALTNGSPPISMRMDPSQSSQITQLSEALAKARHEYENQAKRLREMEDLLVQERTKREDAEARAKKLELSAVVDSKAVNAPQDRGLEDKDASTPIEDEASSDIGKKMDNQSATEKLQERLDLIIAEMHEVKMSAEKWKREKEQAEKERDEERTEKDGLLAMVASFRKEEAERQTRIERLRQRRKSLERAAPPEEAVDEELELEESTLSSPLSRANTVKPKSHFSNGHLSVPLQDSGWAGTKPGQGHLVQASPYLSAMSVVLIGVAVMALVNKMSRGEK